jgi:hypothetical protein
VVPGRSFEEAQRSVREWVTNRRLDAPTEGTIPMPAPKSSRPRRLLDIVRSVVVALDVALALTRRAILLVLAVVVLHALLDRAMGGA